MGLSARRLRGLKKASYIDYDRRKIWCKCGTCLGAKNEGHMNSSFFVESVMVAFSWGYGGCYLTTL